MSYTYYDVKDATEIDIFPTPDDWSDEDWFDYSTLNDLATCPTLGIIRHGYGKINKKGGRRMALEAGSAAHEVYAAARLLQLFDQGEEELFEREGLRLFKENRFDNMKSFMHKSDPRTRRMAFCLEALYSSGFEDDDYDKQRTMGNLEESCIAYLDRFEYDRFPVWVSDDRKLVGVEVPIDIIIRFSFSDGVTFPVRYVGRVDGIHTEKDKPERIILNENKSASRLSDNWRSSFMLSHQVTGYALAMSTVLKKVVEDVHIYGMALPIPRNYDASGFLRIPERRTAETHFPQFLRWVLHNVQTYYNGLRNPLEQPKFTHSCNRYFSTCSYTCICASHAEDREDQFKDMEVEFWNPLAEEDE